MAWAVSFPTTSTKLRLFPNQASQNFLALQDVISASSLNGSLALFPYTASPTPAPVFFYLDAAPPGWTLVGPPPSDCLLAIKGGPIYVTGGVVTGVWTTGAHTLTQAEIPAHTHSIPINTVANIAFQNGAFNFVHPSGVGVTGSIGGGMSHNHDWDSVPVSRPTAAVGIFCTKDA